MVEISKFLVINEQKDQDTEAECCPQCGSLGVAHFEDETDTPSELQHRCLRCSSDGASACVPVPYRLHHRDSRASSCTRQQDLFH